MGILGGANASPFSFPNLFSAIYYRIEEIHNDSNKNNIIILKEVLILAEIGVITEQGDLGLGYNPLSQEEQRLVEESAKNGKENEDKK